MSPVLSFFLFFFKFPFYDCFCFLFLVLISFVCIAFAPNLGGFFALYILFSVLRHDIFSVFHLFVVFRWPWDLSFACFWDLLWFFPCYHVSLPNLQRSIRQTALWKQTPIRVRCALGVICWMVFRYVSFFSRFFCLPFPGEVNGVVTCFLWWSHVFRIHLDRVVQRILFSMSFASRLVFFSHQRLGGPLGGLVTVLCTLTSLTLGLRNGFRGAFLWKPNSHNNCSYRRFPLMCPGQKLAGALV